MIDCPPPGEAVTASTERTEPPVREVTLKQGMAVFHAFTRLDAAAIALLMVLETAFITPVVRGVIPLQFFSDYQPHIAFAWKLDITHRLQTPDFLYELLVVIAHDLVRTVGYDVDALIVTVVAYVALAIVVYAFIRRHLGTPRTYRATAGYVGLTLSLLLVNQVFLFDWTERHLYLGYVAITVYHNPTVALLKPLAVLLFIGTVGVVEGGQSSPSPGFVVWLGTLTVVSTLAKPSYVICLLPALCLLIGYRFLRRRPVAWGAFVLGIVAPAGLTLGWQFLFTYRTADSLGKGRSSIVFAPLAVYHLYSGALLPKFILSILFPTAVYVLYFRRARQDMPLNLCWLAFGFGAFYSYFLAESGQRMTNANFFWSGQITLFILFVVSTVFLLRSLDGFAGVWSAVRRPEPRVMLATTAFGLHLLCGVLYYVIYLLTPGSPRW